MRCTEHTWRGILRSAAGAALLLTLPLTTAAAAQDAGASAAQASIGRVDDAELRTIADMQAFDAAHPNLPVAIAPLLPTMDFAEYLLAKQAASAAPASERSAASFETGQAGPPALGALHCNGIGQLAPITGGLFPPDTHAAVGANHFGQIVNSAVRFYTKGLTGNCPTAIVINVSLAGFFGYFNQTLFDPRIVYDLTYNRWIVSAEAFPQAANIQFHFIAVSVDSDPTHGFFIYPFNMAGIVGNNIFWDYPQVGYDEEAVILTGNKFSGNNYVGSTPVFLPKHRMYAGLGFSFCFFNGGPLNVGTLAPPIVLDQGPYTVLAVASPGANIIRVNKFLGTSHVCPSFFASNDIATATGVPPNAAQPGTVQVLDTIDGRFQNASTQFGTPVFGSPVRFWQVRTQGPGLPTPLTYKINADTLTIEESCAVFAAAASNDFNPSIVTNGAQTIFVTWSSTNPSAAAPHNAQVRITGKKVGDACGTLLPGILVNESTNPLTGNFDPDHGSQRWGDYSAVTLDPANFTVVWGVNEKVQTGANPTTWKSYIFNMTNP